MDGLRANGHLLQEDDELEKLIVGESYGETASSLFNVAKIRRSTKKTRKKTPIWGEGGEDRGAEKGKG
jgi:hypothetical protein